MGQQVLPHGFARNPGTEFDMGGLEESVDANELATVTAVRIDVSLYYLGRGGTDG
jgi:hypothetical protein